MRHFNRKSVLMIRCINLHKALALLCVFAILNAGCATPPIPSGTHTWTKPCNDCVPGIRNFAKVSDVLWRGNHPSRQGFINLERMGIKTVVSLRYFHNDCALLKGTNLKYIRIPASAYDPREEELVKFLKVVEDPDNWPVFVYCSRGNDRTGYVVAAYRLVIENWGLNDAIAEMFDFHYLPMWSGILKSVSSLDVERIKEKLKAEPKPRLYRCE